MYLYIPTLVVGEFCYIRALTFPSNQNAVTKATSTNSEGVNNWREELDNGLFEVLGRQVRINEFDGKIEINTANKYEVFIANGKSNDLRVSCILSKKEFESALNNK